MRAQQASAAGQNDVTAIDILLDPDATMMQRAKAANAQLLQHFPKGFTLGGVHAPHITMLQRFVKTADLPKVYAAADEAIANANPTSWKLTAYKYDHIGEAKLGNEIVGVGNILVKPTPEVAQASAGIGRCDQAVRGAHRNTRRIRHHSPVQKHPISPRTSFTTSQSSSPITAEIITSRTSALGSAPSTF